MPEAGLSVPRDQTRRREDAKESVSTARHSHAGPRPVRAGPSDPVDARAIARDRGRGGRVAADGGAVRRVAARPTGTNGARDHAPSRDQARSAAGRARPRDAVRSAPERAAARETSGHGTWAPVGRPGSVSGPATREVGRPTNPDPARRVYSGTAVPGRRTVRIQGRGSERYAPSPDRRPHRKRYERDGFKPDRAAMWAVLLGVVLIVVAATSSHAAVRSRAAASAQTRVAVHAGVGARAHVGGASRCAHPSGR
jgi:hypothetical protein